jgi:hypothetical protein
MTDKKFEIIERLRERKQNNQMREEKMGLHGKFVTRFEKIHRDDLMIDPLYQRGVNPHLVTRLVKNFNKDSFGVLTVSERANGDKYILDGQHRWKVAQLCVEEYLPCHVYEGLTLQDEARIFSDINTNRVGVTALYRYRAGVIAGSSPEKEIDAWVQANGWRVGNSSSIDIIAFVLALVKTWVSNSNACKEALLAQRAISTKFSSDHIEPMHVNIHTGLHYLLTSVDSCNNPLIARDKTDTYIDKLARLGGLSAILKSIKRIEIELNHKTIARTNALGILRLLNYKMQGCNRLELPERRGLSSEAL